MNKTSNTSNAQGKARNSKSKGFKLAKNLFQQSNQKATQRNANGAPTDGYTQQLHLGIPQPVVGGNHQHVRHAHKKHQHDHFKEDLEKAIKHFESSKESYANCLLYPEVCMARVPFICPVPTALARGVSIYTFTPDNSAGDTFAWSFIPEAIYNTNSPGANNPFYYASAASSIDQITCSSAMTRESLFPNIQFTSIDAMRIVGASVTVTQTQRLVDRAGYGQMSRVYGLSAGGNVQSKSVIINSTYKDEANFSAPGQDDHLRMVYAPGDFSDLHLKKEGTTDNDNEKYPVIQGFLTGFGTSVVSVTFEFNVVVEYVPKPILYQMVERKPAVVSSTELSRGENIVARTDTGVNPPQLEQLQSYASIPEQAQRKIGYSMPKSGRSDFQSFLSGFGSKIMGTQPMLQTAAQILPLLGTRSVYPLKVESDTANNYHDSRAHDERADQRDSWRDPDSKRLLNIGERR